jgi:hypothetical protein
VNRECIGCGCTDNEACDGGCSWALVQGAFGICSNCVESFDNPQTHLEEAAQGRVPRWEDDDDMDGSGLILPGDPEFNTTLRGSR